MTSEVFAQEDVFWANTDEMVAGLTTIFDPVFKKASLAKDGKLYIVPRDEIAGMDFLNGLNIVLGFQKRRYTTTPETHYLQAESVPYLRHGINNIYVYSSICQPVRVGEVCVPLLKSVWLDTSSVRSNVFGEVRHVVVKNPMYLPLSSTSINSIEVNIRSDSGHLIPFVEGSTSVLTLHFKRQ